MTSASVLKTITSDQSLAQPPSKANRLCYNMVRQATMQATSETTWNFVTRDQSLAGSYIMYINRHVTSDHSNIHKRTTSDQVASTKHVNKLKKSLLLASSKPMFVGQVPVQSFRERIWPFTTTFHRAGVRPLMDGKVLPHCLMHLKELATSGAG